MDWKVNWFLSFDRRKIWVCICNIYLWNYRYLISMNWYNIIKQSIAILRCIDFFPHPLSGCIFGESLACGTRKHLHYWQMKTRRIIRICAHRHIHKAPTFCLWHMKTRSKTPHKLNSPSVHYSPAVNFPFPCLLTSLKHLWPCVTVLVTPEDEGTLLPRLPHLRVFC